MYYLPKFPSFCLGYIQSLYDRGHKGALQVQRTEGLYGKLFDG